MDTMLNNNIIEAKARSWDHILNYLSPLYIKYAIQLEISDIIHKNANPMMSFSDLIAALPNLNPSKTTFILILIQVFVDFNVIFQFFLKT